MSLAQFGQYPAPQHTIAHISDTHLLADGSLQFGEIDTAPHLVRALALLHNVELPPQAIIVSGDLADRGEPAAYEHVKELVEDAATRLGASVVWGIGNHDSRAAYSRILFGERSTAPQDRVYDLHGLRIISLDTTVPGYHHGQLEPEQLAWLASELDRPAACGTLLVMHHPPLPTAADRVSQIIELDAQNDLANILRGTDVRAILSGHLHYPTCGVFAGIPVFAAPATCSTMQLAGNNRSYGVINAAQGIAILHLFEPGAAGMQDAPITHTALPLIDAPLIAGKMFTDFSRLETLDHAQRRETLSKHRTHRNS